MLSAIPFTKNKKNMDDILKILRIEVEVSNRGRNPKLGRGFDTARKLNPWNPLSYIFLIIAFILTIVIAGVREPFQSDSPWRRNPFKWD